MSISVEIQFMYHLVVLETSFAAKTVFVEFQEVCGACRLQVMLREEFPHLDLQARYLEFDGHGCFQSKIETEGSRASDSLACKLSPHSGLKFTAPVHSVIVENFVQNAMECFVCTLGYAIGLGVIPCIALMDHRVVPIKIFTTSLTKFFPWSSMSRPRLVDRSGNGTQDNNKKKNKKTRTGTTQGLGVQDTEDWRRTKMVNT